MAKNVTGQIASGKTAIIGVMIKSNPNEGNQKVPLQSAREFQPGISITNACLYWGTTVDVLQMLENAVHIDVLGRRPQLSSALEKTWFVSISRSQRLVPWIWCYLYALGYFGE
ncbi:DAHP synthetase I/KDSA [Penicillium concentricum]|uniref:3-deoxy-7-phosphoheptulonate synthase n=1 Tax=Penicillium concentricum TaxID=293559 RepID=A0A9W9ST79_9EURO|nr:DAHP synthetase I/KDSA [Penicillium concentricum]KAJ5384197.1 DAHP synthetase I/KDSA [Penicillium concentricum]